MTIKSVDANKVKNWLDEDDAIIIDVRESQEHAAEKIRGAKLHPLASITSKDIPNTDKKIVLQCQKGVRSMRACEKLMQEDATLELYNLEGGLNAWKDAKLPTDSE